ncbi:MAG: hemerythrin domain-containing protein [Tetrasphaera sp.]
MDITTVILEEHAEQRRLFAMLQEIGDSDLTALQAVWQRLRDLLEAHAEAEERVFYPELLKSGKGAADADSAEDETEDAIEDHNDIRDAAAAVAAEDLGNAAWFDALAELDEANGDHMAEEERQGLADMRVNFSLQQRHDLAIAFMSFMNRHRDGVTPVDKDPEAYVAEGGDVTKSAKD